MTTGVPSGVTLKSRMMLGFGSLTHPCETGFPIEKRSFVPWMPIGPPSRHERRTAEKAEIPSARGPKGPFGAVTMKRWVT